MSSDKIPTQPAIEVAPVVVDAPDVDPKPSWHVPLTALETKHGVRLSALESGFARLEQKTDAQTVMLGEIKGMLTSPRARWIAFAIGCAAYAYAKAHHVTIPFFEAQ